MWFLIKAAFWLGLVILLLPTSRSEPASPAPPIATADAISAAGAAVTDLRQFCARQPDACVVGSQAAVAFGRKAQASAKMIYEFLTEKLGPNETGTVSAHKSAAPDVAAQSSHNTLTPADRVPAWRGPQPRPEMLAKRSV
jgi:Family of unknown function (DUF5330)